MLESMPSGANISNHANLADTASRATVSILWTGRTDFAFTLSVSPYPSGSVTDVRITTTAGRDSTVAQQKGTLCTTSSAPACPTAATGSISGKVIGVTDTGLYRTMRNLGAYIRIRTTSDTGGALVGAISPGTP